MEIKLIHILGPILATVAMLFYGRSMVNKERGRSVNFAPAFTLIAGALIFRQVFGDGTFLDRICLSLLDFGIALIIDSRYLKVNRSHPKVFWVPGVLALIVSFIIYFIASLFGWTVNGMFDGMHEPDRNAQVIIELGPDDNMGELEGLLEEYDAVYEDAFPAIGLSEDVDLGQTWLVRLPQDQEIAFLKAVRADKENVDFAEDNFLFKLDPPSAPKKITDQETAGYLANDPGIDQQWWLPVEKANAIHALLKENKPKKKAIVAIVDTGVDNKHEDLKGIFGKSRDKGDKQGHGTHCAGLAGAATNNGRGIASLNWEGRFIEIRAYKGLSDKGSGTSSQVARAITDAADGGADVISLSLGGRQQSRTQRNAVKYALGKGCIVVAAAGNSYGQDSKNYTPAGIDGVICVAAVDQTLGRSFFSNINTSLKMPLAAPGSEIYSTYPGGEYRSMNGTSMATPIVSGLMGVLRAYKPDISAEEAWKLANETAQQVPASNEVGRVIDPLAALQKVLGKTSGI